MSLTETHLVYLLVWLFARKRIFHIYFPKVCALCRYYIWSKQIATFQSSDSSQNRPPPGERWYRLIKTRLERAHKFGIPSGGFLAARWINVANCNCRGNFASPPLVSLFRPASRFNKLKFKIFRIDLDFLKTMIAFMFYTIHLCSWHDSCLVLLSGVCWLEPVSKCLIQSVLVSDNCSQLGAITIPALFAPKHVSPHVTSRLKHQLTGKYNK